jgi:hypothetical protein
LYLSERKEGGKMDKELKEIVKALVDQDFQVKTSRRGHVIVRKDGTFVTVFAGTPSDQRSRRNSLAACKRHGFQWPPR